jgi:hypothetical protein
MKQITKGQVSERYHGGDYAETHAKRDFGNMQG